MGFTNSNSTVERSISAAFSNSVGVALADFMEDGNGHGRKDAPVANHSTNSLQAQQQQQTVDTTTSLFCSPYDNLFWIGSDCMRKSASSSLAVIKECATMKTDNTTETSTASPNKDAPAQVSPCNTDSSLNTSSDSSDNWANLVVIENQNQKPTDKNETDNADIISQYDQKHIGESTERYLKNKSLFTDYGDPINSILVEDYTDAIKNSRNEISSRTKVTNKSKQNSEFFDKYHRTNNNALIRSNTTTEPEEGVWFSASAFATSAWCGGYSSLLMYNTSSDAYHEPEKKQSTEEPLDYYAEFKPRRQYAFDEDDCNESTVTMPSLVDSDHSPPTPSTEAAAIVSDGNSVMTGSSSIQSFNVINRPHTDKSSSSTRLVEKIERKSSSSSQLVTPDKDQHRHLHRFMENRIPDQIGGSNKDSDSDSNPFDFALTQSLMRKLQKHLPSGKRGDSFWLQYSLIRDGASLDSLLGMVQRDSNNNISSNICSVLAIETVEGEVFGAFLTQSWRRSQRQWYGGAQSFLWTTSLETKPPTSDGKQSNSNLSVFPYSSVNSYVQLCDRDRLLVGGGDGGSNYERHCYGFGLALERDLLTGSSCPCTTFQSPSLSKVHSNGSTFEIRNLEVWTLTPSLTMVDIPSEGLVRVHKKDKPRLKETRKPPQAPPTTRNDAANNDQSCRDFYMCSAPDCHDDSDDIDVPRDLSSQSFPPDVVRNRNAHRHNSQRQKNRNKHLSLNTSM